MPHFTKEDQYRVRWLRQLLAFLFAFQILSLAPDFASLYGPQGRIALPLLTLQKGAIIMPIAKIIDNVCKLLGISAAQGCYLIIALYLSLCAAFAFVNANLIRIVILALLLLHIAIFDGIPVYSYGLDYISTSLLFYSLVAPFKPNYYCWLYIRTVQLHLCLVYFFAGLEKAIGPNWWNGEAVWKALNLPYFNQFFHWNFSGLASHPWLFIVGGWIIILLELFYPLAIYIKSLRSIWLWAIILMHVGIAILMNLFGFSIVMIIWNIAAFVLGNYILQKYCLQINLKLNLSRWWRAKDASAQHPPA